MPHSKSRNKTWKHGQLERKAKAMHKDNADFDRDTAHAMSKPSELTPLQNQRLARSAQKLETRRLNKSKKKIEVKNPKKTTLNLRALNKMSSSEFLKATQDERSD